MKVVLVDDNDMDIFINEKLLESGGFNLEIHTFPDPDKGLNYMQENNDVDFIFVDNQMPGYTGLQFVEAMMAVTASKPRIIILTASVDDKDVADFHAYNSSIQVWEKPMDSERFKSLL